MELVQKLIDLIDKAIAASGGIAIGVEIILRLLKTKKPLSIAWVLADFFQKLAVLLDKVLPQRLKELEEK